MTEFRHGNGRGDGHIEALHVACRGGEGGDEQPPVDAGGHFGRYALAFVAHDDDAAGCERFGVDVAPLEKGAVNGCVGRQLAEVAGEGGVVDFDLGQGAHGGLDDLWGIDVGGVGRAHDVADAKPVAYAHDGAQVARVLDVVEGEHEVFAHVVA